MGDIRRLLLVENFVHKVVEDCIILRMCYEVPNKSTSNLAHIAESFSLFLTMILVPPILSLGYPSLELLGLRNLVNVYASSTDRNDPVYTELPDLIFSCADQ